MTAVTVSRSDGVATVIVDKPPVNPLSRDVLAGLEQAGAALADDCAVRAVVLTGGGEQAFMAGADITEFEALLAGGETALAEYLAWSTAIFDTWSRLPQPVIAAVQANAMGGGLEFALVCDLIVIDPGARVGLPEVKLGLIPGGGGTQRLRARVGAARAKRMMMLGSALAAEEALACGLVDLVAAPGEALAEGRKLAERLAALPAVAVQAIKRAVDEPGVEDLRHGLAAERTAFAAAFASEDFREGYSAFLAKRRPAFNHR